MTRSHLALTVLAPVVVAVALTVSASSLAAGRSVAGSRSPVTAQLAGRWQRLPPAPVAIDEGLSSVWTGSEMLVFGRKTKRAEDGAVLERVNVAASFDPRTDTWRRLPSPGPTRSFLDYNAVWTGREMLVWGQGTREAYHPSTSRWRQLPGSPYLAVHDGFGLVEWTGREMIGWGGGCCGDAFSDGVAFDPATNRWRALARSPLAGSQHPIGAWTGHELIVFVGGLDPDGKPWPPRLALAAAYNPATNTWRRVEPLPASRADAQAVWDGHEILVVGGAHVLRGFAYNPVTNRWRRLPRMDSGRIGAALVWTGKRLLVWGGSTAGYHSTPALPAHGLAYEPRRNLWSALPTAPIVGRPSPTAVWTGRALIVWGGGEVSRPFTDGAAFTPAAG